MDANYVLYLLELFEGKISISDILEIDCSLLNSLEESRIKQIDEKAKNLNTNNSNNTPSVINNKKERHKVK